MLADGREEGIDWVELTGVEVLTAKGGPYGAAGGVVILCGDDEHGCLVPIDRIEDSGLAEALTRLPGFDMRRLLEATRAGPSQADGLLGARRLLIALTPCGSKPA